MADLFDDDEPRITILSEEDDEAGHFSSEAHATEPEDIYAIYSEVCNQGLPLGYDVNTRLPLEYFRQLNCPPRVFKEFQRVKEEQDSVAECRRRLSACERGRQLEVAQRSLADEFLYTRKKCDRKEKRLNKKRVAHSRLRENTQLLEDTRRKLKELRERLKDASLDDRTKADLRRQKKEMETDRAFFVEACESAKKAVGDLSELIAAEDRLIANTKIAKNSFIKMIAVDQQALRENLNWRNAKSHDFRTEPEIWFQWFEDRAKARSTELAGLKEALQSAVDLMENAQATVSSTIKKSYNKRVRVHGIDRAENSSIKDIKDILVDVSQRDRYLEIADHQKFVGRRYRSSSTPTYRQIMGAQPKRGPKPIISSEGKGRPVRIGWAVDPNCDKVRVQVRSQDEKQWKVIFNANVDTAGNRGAVSTFTPKKNVTYLVQTVGVNQFAATASTSAYFSVNKKGTISDPHANRATLNQLARSVRKCSKCGKKKSYHEYALVEWKKRRDRRCERCANVRCFYCGTDKPAKEIVRRPPEFVPSDRSICRPCLESEKINRQTESRLECSICEKERAISDFSKTQRAKGSKRKCIPCIQLEQRVQAHSTAREKTKRKADAEMRRKKEAATKSAEEEIRRKREEKARRRALDRQEELTQRVVSKLSKQFSMLSHDSIRMRFLYEGDLNEEKTRGLLEKDLAALRREQQRLIGEPTNNRETDMRSRMTREQHLKMEKQKKMREQKAAEAKQLITWLRRQRLPKELFESLQRAKKGTLREVCKMDIEEVSKLTLPKGGQYPMTVMLKLQSAIMNTQSSLTEAGLGTRSGTSAFPSYAGRSKIVGGEGNVRVLLDKALGKGTSGYVYEGELMHSVQKKPIKVAVKKIDQHQYGRREVNALSELKGNPFVIDLLTVVEDLEYYYLILELCAFTLRDKIRGENGATPFRNLNERKLVLLQLANALKFLHVRDVPIAHRDLKPGNVLISFQGDVKLCDMGLAKEFNGEEMTGDTTQTVTHVGTRGWRAPEAIPGSDYDVKVGIYSDVFCYGLIVHYVLCNGDHPYGTQTHERVNNILKGYQSINTEALTPTGLDLVNLCLVPEHDKRISIESANAHPLFWEGDRSVLFLTDVYEYLKGMRENVSPKLRDIGVELCKSFDQELGFKWRARLDTALLTSTKSSSKYPDGSMYQLLHLMRNVKHHRTPYITVVGQDDYQLMEYFERKFPHLLMNVTHWVKKHKKKIRSPALKKLLRKQVTDVPTWKSLQKAGKIDL